MKILFIGDPHLRINRFNLGIELFRWIEDIISKEKPDIVVNLGDTFHDHAILRAELLEEFRNHVNNVAALAPYYYILGNHDQYKPKDAKYHALQNFKNINNFHVIEETTEISGLTMVPYIADHSQFPLDTQKICIAHQTFIGADYGYMRESAGVDAGKVKADIIISGHVHKKQEFGKVVYPGIPYAQNANDVDQTKAILLFDTETYDKKWIYSPFPLWRSITYEVSQDQPIDGLYEILNEEVNDKDHFIVKVIGPKAEIAAFLSSKKYKDIAKKTNIMPRPEFTDKDKKTVSLKSKDVKQVLKDCVDKIYDGGVNKDILTKELMSLYDEASINQ